MQVKSYGDLTIAASGLRKVPGSELERFGLVISPHLRELVVSVSEACADVGHAAELLLLEGERREHPDVVPTRDIPRHFAALSDALASYNAAVSTDSLPAHLAEYRGTPVFVVSPHANSYWLPPGAHHGHSWGVFHDRDELARRLRRFLESSCPG